MQRDGSFAAYGPDPPAIRLFVAAILCAEMEDFPPDPSIERDVAQEIADKSEKYAQYLSLFFIVSRRKNASRLDRRNSDMRPSSAD